MMNNTELTELLTKCIPIIRILTIYDKLPDELKRVAKECINIMSKDEKEEPDKKN